MLVKILEADPDFVQALKNQTGMNTASKAYAHAADRYQHLRVQLSDKEYEIEALEAEVEQLKAALKEVYESSLKVVDILGKKPK